MIPKSPRGGGRTLRPAVVLVASVLVARVVYLVWLSPYELVADEAQYWDWSRRLSLSYYSKGPAVAYLIAAATAVFGTSEWSVRLPAALASAAAALFVARLAVDSLPEDQRSRAALVGLAAAALFTAAPAFQLSALLMTPDTPYVACWAIAAWAAWRVFERRRAAASALGDWLLLATALGVGCLAKYTILLLVPGLLGFFWVSRRELRPASGMAGHAAIASAILVILVSPMVVWNWQHDWAGARHLLGFPRLPGGDVAARSPYTPVWTAEYLVAQAGIVGPSLLLMVVSAIAALKSDERTRSACRFMICCAVPTFVLFLLASFRTPIEGNWPIAAYTTLIVPAAQSLRLRMTSPRYVTLLWGGSCVWAAVAAFFIHAPLVGAHVPLVGRFIPVHRMSGAANLATVVNQPLEALRQQTGTEPLVIAGSHNQAGLLAFYLPGRPRVASAGRFMGLRPSAYDFFEDTDLASRSLEGRPVLLIGGNRDRWEAAFLLDDVRQRSPLPLYSALGFRGPRD